MYIYIYHSLHLKSHDFGASSRAGLPWLVRVSSHSAGAGSLKAVPRGLGAQTFWDMVLFGKYGFVYGKTHGKYGTSMGKPMENE